MARILRLEPEITTRRQFHHTVQNQVKHIEEIGSPVINDSNQIVGRLLVLRDVTEEKMLEEYRDDLTKMMVHDLRGPLAAIINGLTVALPTIDVEEYIEDTRTLLNASLTSANRLMRLVNSLMDIGGMDGPEMRLDLNPVSPAAIIETAFLTLATSIQQAEIKINFDIPNDLPLANVDKDKIERVLINLLDNALRYTPVGGEILISARALPESRQVQIKVADSGPGIPPQERNRIFDKFRRVKGQDPLRGSKGNGLGLTFCKLAIEAHGGRIQVENDSPLPGACFSFTLPTASML
jgi:signal transduction histidine kinase